MSEPQPHTPECFVYRYAPYLLGVDRRGMCDCGAEQINEKRLLDEQQSPTE